MKYILIDLDGTLLDFKTGEKESFSKTIEELTSYKVSEEDKLKFSEINDFYFNEYKNKKMDRNKFHLNRFKYMLNYLNLEYDPVKMDLYYVNELKYHAEIFNDVIEILDYLYPNYKLYVASNGMKEVQIKRMEIADIKKYFINYYISEEVGYNKPDKEFFQYIFNDIKDPNKDEYIIIGDRIDSDIIGGKDSNIKTIYLNRDDDTKSIDADYNIKSLLDLKNIL